MMSELEFRIKIWELMYPSLNSGDWVVGEVLPQRGVT